MLFKETYKEIKASSKGYYKEKNSKFIAYAYKVYSEDDVKRMLDNIRKKENTAQHYCYAYVLNIDKSAQRHSDDGEPSSTAGRPIINQILSKDITNILIIVVRYFGGTKLGIPGLIRSYKNAANDAINNTNIIVKIIKEIYEINFKHHQMNDVMRIIKRYNLEVINKELQMNPIIIFAIQRKKADIVEKQFADKYGIRIKYLKTKK